MGPRRGWFLLPLGSGWLRLVARLGPFGGGQCLPLGVRLGPRLFWVRDCSEGFVWGGSCWAFLGGAWACL